MKRILASLRKPAVMGQFRHILSMIGGGLAVRGFVALSEWELYSGILIAGISLILSATAPEKAETTGN
jgi:hypothetical protein